MTVADLIQELQKLDPNMQVAAMRCTCDAPSYVPARPLVRYDEWATMTGLNPPFQGVHPGPPPLAYAVVRFVALVDAR